MSAAEDLASLLVQLATHIGDVRLALVEQGQDAEDAPTSELGDLVRAINPQLPVNVSPPVLTGTVIAGGTLGVSTGTWVGAAPIVFTYQWYLDGSLVGGQTTSSYTTDPGDFGLQVYARVTATNSVASAFVETAPVTLVEPDDASTITADTTTITADSSLITADHEAV